MTVFKTYWAGLGGGIGPINTQIGNYTLALSDAGNIVEINSGSAATITVPAHSSVAFVPNTAISIAQIGAGQVSIQAAGGVTLRSYLGYTKLAGQYTGASLYNRGIDDWVLIGSLTA